MDGEDYSKTDLMQRLQGSLDLFDDATAVVTGKAANRNV